MKARIASLTQDARVAALVDQGVVSASNFLSLVVVARHLTPEDFGLFSLALMSTQFLANMHRAVFTQPMNILASGDSVPQALARLKTLLFAQWASLPLALCALAAAGHYFFPGLPLLASVAFYVAAFFPQEMLRRYWYTINRSRDALYNDLISYAGQVVLLVLVGAVWRLDGPRAFYVMGGTSLLAYAVGRLQLRGMTAVGHQRPATLLGEQWTIGKWLVLTSLGAWGAGLVYPFLMAPLGTALIASFSVCRNLLNVTGVVSQSATNYLPGRLARLYREQGRVGLRHHMRWTLIRVIGVCALFLVLMDLGAQPLLHLLYGGRYDEAAPLLRILAWSAVASMIGVFLGCYSLGLQDSRAGFFANLGGSLVTFTVGLWLIRTYGVTGAAVATLCSLSTATLLQGVLLVRRFRASNPT